jgi:hypothetical protein
LVRFCSRIDGGDDLTDETTVRAVVRSAPIWIFWVLLRIARLG